MTGRKLNTIEELYKVSLGSMNYIFLRYALYRDELPEFIIDELETFLNTVSDLESQSDSSTFDDVLIQEMIEGSHLDKFSLKEIRKNIREALIELAGDDSMIFLYMGLFEKAKKEREVQN